MHEMLKSARSERMPSAAVERIAAAAVVASDVAASALGAASGATNAMPAAKNAAAPFVGKMWWVLGATGTAVAAIGIAIKLWSSSAPPPVGAATTNPLLVLAASASATTVPATKPYATVSSQTTATRPEDLPLAAAPSQLFSVTTVAAPSAIASSQQVRSLSIDAEIELIRTIRGHERAGESAAALTALDHYFVQYPAGGMNLEARVLRVRALTAVAPARARSEAEATLGAYPNSPYSSELRKVASP
jgi:hypothetical protein